MGTDFRKLASVTILPTILLSCSFFFLPQLSKPLPIAIEVILLYMPYVICITGMVLSWTFHHSREFNLFLLFGIIYILLNKYIWNSEHDVDIQLAYVLIVLLIPINFLVNFLLKERGILNRFGMRRFIIIAIQVYCITLLLDYPYPPLKEIFTFPSLERTILIITPIPALIFVTIIFTGAWILFKLIKTSSILFSGIFASLLAITIALHFYQQQLPAILFIVLAGLLLVVSITINAYSLAYLDELTNLPSRRALTQNISTLGKRYSIAMVDVDHFKKFNDKYGHDVGDQVLKKLASHLRQVRGGKAFRYGGEEFTILFSNKSCEEARLYCDDLCKTIANSPFMFRAKDRPKRKQADLKVKQKQQEAKPLKVTISIGLAEHSQNLITAEEVIKQADKALYKAKNNGRNQVVAVMPKKSNSK